MTRIAKGYPLPEGAACFDGHYVDAGGNPLVVHDGCPNCRSGRGWIPAAFAGIYDVPCSRKCALQMEYAESLKAARDEGHAAETEVGLKSGRKAGAEGAESLRRSPASASAASPRAELPGGKRG